MASSQTFHVIGLRAAGVGRLGQLAAELLDLVDRRERRHLVGEEPLVVRVFPAGVVGVVGVADAVVLDPVADLHDVLLELLEAAGEVAVDHRLGRRVVDRQDHRGVFAGRIVGPVVLRLDVVARFVESQQGVLPRPGNTVAFRMQYGYSAHQGSLPGQTVGRSAMR